MIKTWIATLPFLIFGCGEVKEKKKMKEPKEIAELILEKSKTLEKLEWYMGLSVEKEKELRKQLEQAKKITNEDLQERVTDILNKKLDWEIEYIGILAQKIKDQKELDSLGIDIQI